MFIISEYEQTERKSLLIMKIKPTKSYPEKWVNVSAVC